MIQEVSKTGEIECRNWDFRMSSDSLFTSSSEVDESTFEAIYDQVVLGPGGGGQRADYFWRTSILEPSPIPSQINEDHLDRHFERIFGTATCFRVGRNPDSFNEGVRPGTLDHYHEALHIGEGNYVAGMVVVF
jgi:hypothetical protein